MIKDASVHSILLFLFSVFCASGAQVLLKKSALIEHTGPISEYLNWRVVLGYVIMFLCTWINVVAYRGIPLSLGMMLEATSYIYVTIFGFTIFKEKISGKKLVALGLIIGGILLYTI